MDDLEDDGSDIDDVESERFDEFSETSSTGVLVPFKVNPLINLKSKALLDMISLNPVVTELTAPMHHASAATKTPEAQTMSVDEAFSRW